jgi:D-amino peptidase
MHAVHPSRSIQAGNHPTNPAARHAPGSPPRRSGIGRRGGWRTPLLLGALLATAVGGWEGDTPLRSPADGGSEISSRTLADPAPVHGEGPRVLIYHDMEGLSGQDDPNTFRFAHPGPYALGRQLLTADVNAVIEGLFEGGAVVVHVVDGHGSGNPEPDLLLDQLDPRAEMVFRDQPFDAYVDLIAPDTYDAIAVVGMHAKTGSGGFASHTYTLGIDVIMNGMHLTETEIVGYSWGRVGVPVIFASGDDRLEADLAGTMPWLEFVQVKRATSASAADLRPVDEARADLREGARRAMLDRDRAQVMRLDEPVHAALRAVPPANLAVMEGVPGIRYRDDRVEFTASDFREAYDGATAIVSVARTGYQSVLLETIRDHPDGAGIMAAYSDDLFARWLDFESGRWEPPPPSAPAESLRHFGFR